MSNDGGGISSFHDETSCLERIPRFYVRDQYIIFQIHVCQAKLENVITFEGNNFSFAQKLRCNQLLKGNMNKLVWASDFYFLKFFNIYILRIYPHNNLIE